MLELCGCDVLEIYSLFSVIDNDDEVTSPSFEEKHYSLALFTPILHCRSALALARPHPSGGASGGKKEVE